MNTDKNPSFQCPKLFQRAEFLPDSFNKDNETIEVIWSTGQAVYRESAFKEPFIEELSLNESAVHLDRLNQGAPVLNTHQHHGINDVIGVVERAWITSASNHTDTPAQGLATIRFSKRKEVAPIVEDVKDGILRNISVGYFVYCFEDVTKDDENTKRLRAIDWRPHELSLVPINADSGAVVRDERSHSHFSHCALIKQRCRTIDTTIITDNALTLPDNTDSILPKPNERRKHMQVSPENNKTHHTADENNSNNIVTADTENTWSKSTQDNKDNDNGKDSKSSNGSSNGNNNTIEKTITAERKRVQEIMTLVRTANLSHDMAEQLIVEGASIETAQKRVLATWASTDSPSNAIHNNNMSITQDETDTRVRAMTDVLLHRFNPNRYPVTDLARSYYGLSLLDMARECVSKAHVNDRHLSKLELSGRALHSTSDFPMILSNVANKTLRDAYDATPQTFRPFVRVVSVSDFKPVTRVQLGDAPSLEKVNEHGEFTYGTIGEAQEQYRIATFGKIMQLTRQTIINDDLGAFTRIPELLGRSAADLESKLVYSVLTNNAVMGDGNALFSNQHHNVATSPGELSIQSMGEARKAMRLQQGLNGARVNVTPEYLLVPAELETKAQQFIAQNFTPNVQDNINPFAGHLQIITEARLDEASSSSWYLLASPSAIDMIELAYLQGQQGIYLETAQGFDVDGIKIKARLDVGVKAIDWRGFYKNPGVSTHKNKS